MNRLAVVVAISCLSTVTACASSNAASKQPDASAPAPTAQNITDAPLQSLSYMRQGSVLMQQGRYQEALESFQVANRIAPGNATNLNMIGLCYLSLRQPDQALKSFDQVLQMVPQFTDARNNRGATYLMMEQYHLAEVDFIAVLADSTYPHRKQAYYNLGMTYLQRGQLGAAEENFRKSIIPPNPVYNGFLQLAKLAQQQGSPDRALVFLQEAKLEYPDSTEISFELGKLLMIMGEEDDARAYLEQVISDAPDSNEAATARTLLAND
jgi:tetratricopeptide (TPR) repeat protein